MTTRSGAFVLLALLSACVRNVPQTPAEPPGPTRPAGPRPIEIPRRDGVQTLVLPVRPVNAPLLPAELGRLGLWVARHLAIQPDVMLSPIPPAEVAAVIARVEEEGRLTAEGPTCVAQPAVRRALTLQWPAAAVARSAADCSNEPCRLVVEVVAPGPSKDLLGTWVAEVSAPADFAAWEQAAQALQPAPGTPLPPEPGPVEAAVRPPFVSIQDVDAFGAWDERPTRGTYAGALGALEACHEKGRTALGPHQVVIDYAPDGTARHCAGYAATDPAPRGQLACYCRAASAVRVSDGGDTRRVILSVRDRPELTMPTQDRAVIAARVLDFRSSDPAITADHLAPALPWVALCYGTTRLREPVQFPVRFELDASGKVLEAQIEGPGRGHTLGPCVDGYLRYHPFPCPPTGAATVEFDLRIERSEAGASAPSSRAPTRGNRARAR